MEYTPHYFHAYDKNGKEIYHTNVMMCIGRKFAVVCLESISDKNERTSLQKSLEESGHQIIDINFLQMNHFAGNMLALLNEKNEELLVMSQNAYDSLTPEQKDTLKQYSRLVPIPIDTIETVGGGSARCMIAELYLPEK